MPFLHTEVFISWLLFFGSNKVNNHLNFDGFRIGNIGDPLGIHDVASKNYVDNHVKYHVNKLYCITDRFRGGGNGWMYSCKVNEGIPIAYKCKLMKLALTAKNRSQEMQTSVCKNGNESINHRIIKPKY